MKKLDKKYLLFTGLVLITIGFLTFAFMFNDNGKYDSFAMCLKQKDIKMYGASWCPHCQEQKKMFESSQKYLNYVECSTIDGTGQTDVCKNNQISSYPTWELSNGTKLAGTYSFEKLSEISGCVLD